METHLIITSNVKEFNKQMEKTIVLAKQLQIELDKIKNLELEVNVSEDSKEKA